VLPITCLAVRSMLPTVSTMKLHPLSVLVIFAASTAEAQSLPDYRCRIDRVATSERSPNSQLDFMAKNYVGKEFAVDRRTGVMTGALRNSFITRPDVIDRGSEDNSYKVVTTLRLEQGAGRGSNVYVLIVNEYQRTPEKPFLFLNNDIIYFGICTHM
jgi:hypothetical protein